MVIIPIGLKIFRSQNTKDSKNDMKYSNLSYSSSKVQYFAAKDFQYDTFSLK